MKNFLRVAVLLAVVLCVAIAMVACAKEPATTTAAKTTTAGEPATTTTAGGETVTTTTPAATTTPVVTTTPIVTTTPGVTTTESPYFYKMPNLTIDGVEQKNTWIFDANGYFIINEEGFAQADTARAIGELVGVEFTSGTIETEFVLYGGSGAYDTGIMFAISDPFDAEMPYYFETQCSYWWFLTMDSGDCGISRCGWDGDGNGEVEGWFWCINSTGPFHEGDGSTVTMKVETDGKTWIEGSLNGEVVVSYTIPEDANLFNYGSKVALRAEGIGTYFKWAKIENVEE